MPKENLAATILDLCVSRYPDGLTDEGATEILKATATVAGLCLARFDPVCVAPFIQAVMHARSRTKDEAGKIASVGGLH